MINFDSHAASAAAKIVSAANNSKVKMSDLDNQVTTAMNILTEQGIYAMCLWLKEKKYEHITKSLNNFFKEPENPLYLKNNLPGHEACLELTSSLKSMFLARQLIELILTYARHMAKAEKG